MKFLEIAKEGRHFVALLLSVGVLQIAGYWFSGSLVKGPESLAVAQPDTLLYCQAATRVAEGHPFSYSADTAPCTGTTSVLYPFVLAIPHILGFKGAALVSAGFWLNAIFYLIFLVGWGLFIWKRFADPLVRFLGGVWLAIFPGTAYCTFAQSDIGFWLAVSGFFAGTLASEKKWLYAILLVLAPWVRPEGMVVVIAFSVVAAWYWRKDRYNLSFAALGLFSTIGVFVLNYMLTGHFQFSSVANKGHFATNPFPMAVQKTACDLIRILKDLSFGQAVSPPRMFYSIPFLGAILIWLGVFTHDWRGKWRECDSVLLLMVGAGILMVAQSGWQNTNVDRYLAWVMPIFVVFAAEGATWAYRKLKERSSAAALIFVGPTVFSIGSALTFCTLFFACSEESERIAAFGRDLDVIMPQKASYGVTGWCGLAAVMTDRRCAHLGGIYSPEFSACDLNGNLEILRNEPETRFDFWVFAADDKFPKGFKELQGRQIAVGPEGIDVYHADWSAFDYGLKPHPAQIAKGRVEIENLSLVERLDIGYEKDEKRLKYEVLPKYHLRPFDSIALVEKLSGRQVFDVGRIIYGEDEMTVALHPGKDLKIVMRTVAAVDFSAKSMVSPTLKLKYAYSDPLELHIEIDGKEVCHSHAHIVKDGFTDAVFTIPGRVITHSPCRISLHGDHVTFGYWFYQ